MVEIDDPDDQIKAGMTGEVSLITKEKTDALLVPNTALSVENGKNYLTLSASPANTKVEVELGLVSDNISEVISSEIDEGTQIVVSDISSSVLEELGLDPMQYLTSSTGMGQMPPNGAVSETVNGPMTDDSTMDTGDSTSGTESPTDNEQAGISDEEKTNRPQFPSEGQMTAPQDSANGQAWKPQQMGSDSGQTQTASEPVETTVSGE